MQRLIYRDGSAVFISCKISDGWVITVHGYDPSLHSITEKIYCNNVNEVKDFLELFYALPVLKKDKT